MTVLNILNIIFLIIFNIVTITNIIMLLYMYKQLNNQIETDKKKKTTRKHATIKTSNYNSSFNTRGYDQFKNEKTGLYEPQKPHQGIELKPKKEE